MENTTPTPRLKHFKAKETHSQTATTRYSAFIKKTQLILPIVAIMIIAMVFLWTPMTQKTIKLTENTTLSVDSIGINELINPKFESRDDKNRPYIITASKALQNRNNDDLIILEKPSGEMSMNDTEIIAISANNGAFRQKNQKLVLKGNVKIAHSEGPTLDTEELHMDMKTQESWSDTDVHLQSQEGTLSAKGLRTDPANNAIKFIGPGKITLTNLEGQKLFAPSPSQDNQEPKK